MSIPLDKLYHYIENVANEINKDIQGDNVIIYHFYPHGSKNLDDLIPLRPIKVFEILPPIYCHDQEPLNYEFYNNKSKTKDIPSFTVLNEHNCQLVNLSQYPSVYDKSLLIHSELRSSNVNNYVNDNYIPVYYWSHAIISIDWYRYARYEKLKKNITKTFLIYNRAWAGSREYRIKFIDLLIQYNIINYCQTTFNLVDPESNVYYSAHHFINCNFIPNNKIENYNINRSEVLSSASADYEISDYNSTEFEVVLETLFDDDRIQLTEKILRPIALGQPFLLASTHGSLEYLRSYGFKTFSSIIDETYDIIEDPSQRLEAIVKCMRDITNWTSQERKEKMIIANQIVEYNRQHFFSDNFFNQITTELRDNLQKGLSELENTNTGSMHLKRWNVIKKYPILKETIIKYKSRKAISDIIRLARKYYNRRLQQK